MIKGSDKDDSNGFRIIPLYMESLLGGLLNFDLIYGNIKDSKGRPTNVRHTRRHLFFFFIKKYFRVKHFY